MRSLQPIVPWPASRQQGRREAIQGIWRAALTARGEKTAPLLLIVDQFEEIFTDIPEDGKKTRQGGFDGPWIDDASRAFSLRRG